MVRSQTNLLNLTTNRRASHFVYHSVLSVKPGSSILKTDCLSLLHSSPVVPMLKPRQSPGFFVFRNVGEVGVGKGSSQAGLEGRHTGRVGRAEAVHGACIAGSTISVEKLVTSLLILFTAASVALTPSSVVLGGRIHSTALQRVPKLLIGHAKHY